MDAKIDHECITKKIQEIRDASTNWTLKNDKALLNVLETIHKDVISKVNKTNDKYDAQLDQLNRACVSLMNVNNKLSGLCNTQFVENKVQEDDIAIIKEEKNTDDTLIIDRSHQNIDSKESEELKIKERIYSAVAKSLKALEGLCEEINISSDSESGSDNDDNELGYGVVLKPKDIYTKKRLPHIIGTQKWKNKSHIGLQECSSESDEENQLQSENEADLSSSSLSSNGDISQKTRMNEKKATLCLPIPKPMSTDNQSSANSSSTHNSSDTVDSEAIKKGLLVHNVIDDKSIGVESHPYQEPAPQTLVKPSEFAAKLAKKLGASQSIQPTSIDKTDDIPKVTPRSDFQNQTSKTLFDQGLSKKPASRITSNVFLDEPPPIDSKEENKSSMFNDDDYISTGLFGDDTAGSLFKPSQSYQDFNKPKPSHAGLFDDMPDDDDLFSFKKTEKIKTPISKVESVKNNEKIQQQSSLNVKKTAVSYNESDKSKISKGLFDDSDHSDDDDIFGFSKKSKSKIMKQDNNDFPAVVKQKEVPNKNITKAIKLFDDLSDSDSDLFGSNEIFKKVTSTPRNKNDVAKKTDTTNPPKPKNTTATVEKIKVEDKVTAPIKKDQKQEHINILSDKTERSTPNIFDDVSPPLNKNSNDRTSQEVKKKESTEDLFADLKSTKDVIKSPQDDNIFIKKELFDDIPPPLTEEITKDNKFDSNEKLRESSTVLNKGLFDDLPPPLNKDSSESNSPQDDIFANIKGLRETNTTNEGLFDEPPIVTSHSVDIFSDEPPEYTDETPDIQDDIFKSKDDTYEDYPYFKTINKIESKPKVENDKPKSIIVSENKPAKNSQFLESEDELFAPKKSVKKNEPIDRKISLFDDVSDDDQLFSITKKLPEKKTIPSSNINKSENKINKLLQNIEPQMDVTSTTEENEGINVSAPKIGKLQSNMSINVKALLGATNITVSDIKKSVSDAKHVENSTATADIKNATIKSASFDDNPQPSDSTLCNDIIKDRVKIQVKRRPSSRKARHEAARLSVAGDIYVTSGSSAKEFTVSLPSSPTEDLSKSIIPQIDITKAASSMEVNKTVSNTEIISKSETVLKTENISKHEMKIEATIKSKTTEDVLKSDPKSGIIPEFDSKVETVPKTEAVLKSDSIKSTIGSESKLATVIETSSKSKTISNIFSDDSDDSDLFFVSKKSKNNLEDIFKSESSKTESKGAVKKKSIQPNKLFDSDSDSDLFSSAKQSKAPLEKQSKKSKNIFDDDDDGNDFFKAPIKTIAPKNEKKTKSLFDDDAEEIEDIFSLKKDADKLKATKITTEVKPSIVKKASVIITSNAPFEDPLSSFLND